MQGPPLPARDQQSRALYELCALALSIIRSPSLPPASAGGPTPSVPVAQQRPQGRRLQQLRNRQQSQVSAAGLASLLLGVSLAMMFCGSITFVIGFILMPWVLGLIMVLYLVGIVTSLSGFGRSILSAAGSSVSGGSSPKEMPGELFSKLPII